MSKIHSRIQRLTDNELLHVNGGGNFFEDLAHGRVSEAFGRGGKPFIGQDFTRTVAQVAPVVAVVYPPAAPIVLKVAGVAGLSSRIEGQIREQKK